MRKLFLALITCLSIAVAGPQVIAATKKAAPKSRAASTKSAKKAAKTTKSASKNAKSKKKSKAVRAAEAKRLRRIRRAFVASTSLKPMARQLLEVRNKAAYAGVEAYARRHANDDAGPLAYLVLGYAHTLDHEYAAAIPPLKRANAKPGDLGDYTSYLLASAYANTQQPELVISTLRNFEKEYSDSLFLRDAMLMYAEALRQTASSPEAVRVLEKHREPPRADYELALGRAYIESGDAQKGGDILRHLYLTTPASSEANEARTELAKLLSITAPLTYDERRQRADLLMQSRRFADAAAEYAALEGEAPPASRYALEMMYGVALYRSGSQKQAREKLEPLPDGPDEANALRLLVLAEIARSDGDEARFKDVLSRLRQNHSQSPAFEDALMLGGNMYLLKKDYDRAIDHYRESQQRFPQGKRASYVHWKAAWLSWRQGRTEEARNLFEQQIDWYPEGAEVPAALYWRGRLAEEERDLAKAYAFYSKLEERFRNYYYAVLARERLATFRAQGEPAHYAVLDKIPSIAEGPARDTAVPDDDVRASRARLLENAGLTEFAVRELRNVSGDPDAAWAAAEIARIYNEANQVHRALQIMKRTVPAYFAQDLPQLPRKYWEALFPRPYWNDLRRYASANGLDPYLVASLIRQESEFNPGAVSRANAWGLMQVLPGTGKKVAKDLRIRRFNTDQLLSPTTNLQIGTRYFREMIDRFGGQVEFALAAYNAGSDRVDAWRTEKYRDVPEFVESIPFTETREYVQAIMRNAAIYKRLYDVPPSTASRVAVAAR